MKTIKLNRGQVALVDDEDYERLVRYRWRVRRDRHCLYPVTSKGTPMHRFILDIPIGLTVDHANHNGLDNTRSNLRICSIAENNWNARKCPNCSSRFKGVHRRGNKWQVEISVNRNRIYLGQFTSEEQAALAYDDAARRLHGVFACTNFNNGESHVS